MRQPIQFKTKIRSRASALQTTFWIALIFTFASLLASTAVATPILGNYPDTSLPLSTDTTVTPDATPANTTSINVSTSTDFKGTLIGDRATGRGAGDGRASGGNLHGDGHSFRQRGRDRDQEVHVDSNDASNMPAG
jgi:hypothetical protein